jgi:hypothetical protein
LGIEQKPVTSHWNYFLCIEEDISKLSRWIEPSESNFDCYSLEIARLLMTTSAEVDVLARLICKKINHKSKAKGILQYQKELVSEFPNIYRAKVVVPRFGLELTPWHNWLTVETPPIWWQANNRVKHQRSEYFNQATLKNLLNSVAALLLLQILYYQSKINELHPKTQLFIPKSFCIAMGEHVRYSPTAC